MTADMPDLSAVEISDQVSVKRTIQLPPGLPDLYDRRGRPILKPVTVSVTDAEVE